VEGPDHFERIRVDELHSALENAIASPRPELVDVPLAPGMALF